MDWEDALIDDLDAGRLQCGTHRVCRRLVSVTGDRSGIAGEVLSNFDAGTTSDREHLLGKLWKNIEARPLSEQGRLRILVGLLKPDEPIDGHLAGYLVNWARENGASESEIVSAFRES